MTEEQAKAVSEAIDCIEKGRAILIEHLEHDLIEKDLLIEVHDLKKITNTLWSRIELWFR